MKKLETTPHKYQEICDDIIARIQKGEFVPGMRLPGLRALGELFECNFNTVRKAIAVLQEGGYVNVTHGSGTYVAENPVSMLQQGNGIQTVLRTSDRLGVLLPLKQWGHYVNSLIDQLHHSAEVQDISLNIKTVTRIDVSATSLVREFLNQGCCAVILPWTGEDQSPTDLYDFVRMSVLPVAMANPVHGLEENCCHDPELDRDTYHSATYLQCRYFQELGYRNIALLGPNTAEGEYFQFKLMQYSRWCDQEEFPSLIGMVDRSANDYRRIIRRWARYRKELAVIAYHDEMAMEFMNACTALDYSVPDDFAVLGHNNNPAGLRSNPPLSTMLCPYEYLADGMLKHALALSRGETNQLSGREPQAFYIRESCGGRLRKGDEIDSMVTDMLKAFFAS